MKVSQLINSLQFFDENEDVTSSSIFAYKKRNLNSNRPSSLLVN